MDEKILFTIDRKSKRVNKCSTEFKINEKVEKNSSVGDMLGVCKKDNVLWINNWAYLYDPEVQAFLTELFALPITVAMTIKEEAL